MLTALTNQSSTQPTVAGPGSKQQLRVNTPGDSYEQEADIATKRVSKRDFGQTAPSATGPSNPGLLMRSGGRAGTVVSDNFSDNLSRSKGSGVPLPDETRGFMENAFSNDFSGVRVHDNDSAAEMSRDIHAEAFTHENDVYFDRGRYNPGSVEGKELLSHELTHVVQSGRSPAQDVSIRRKADAVGDLESIENNEGDHFPLPIVIDWGEKFELTFGARTTVYGDVKFQIQFKYLGSQKPDGPADEIYLWEQDPSNEDWILGHPHTRRINAKILNYSNHSIQIDIYGDGVVVYDFYHELLPAKMPGVFDHQIKYDKNRVQQGYFTMQFTSAATLPITVGTGTISQLAGSDIPPNPANPPAEAGFPTSIVLSLCIEQLSGYTSHSLSLAVLRAKIITDLQDPLVNFNAEAANRARRLFGLLQQLSGVFPSLGQMMDKKLYLPDLADLVITELERIDELFVYALFNAYGTSVLDVLGLGLQKDASDDVSKPDASLIVALKAFSSFPDWLNKLYLQNSNGVNKLLVEIPKLQRELHELRDLNNSEYEHEFREADEIVKHDPGGGHNFALFNALLDRRNSIELDLRNEAKDVTDSTRDFYFQVQESIGILNALIFYEQFAFYGRQFNDSYINSAIEVVGRDLKSESWGYVNALSKIINDLGFTKYEKDFDVKQQQIQSSLSALEGLGGGMKSCSEAADSRLKWVNRIDIAGKLVLIVAAATITGGIGAELATGLLSTAGVESGLILGAGTIIGNGIGFTVGSRFGQTVFFGTPEGSFTEDVVWNSATLYVGKAVGEVFSKFIKLSEDAGKFAKLGYSAGKTATTLAALHGFSEVQHLIVKHELMSGDERTDAIFQTVVVSSALSAGKFIKEPIEKRISHYLLDKLGFKKTGPLEVQRQQLSEKIKQLGAGQGTAEQTEDILNKEVSILTNELEIINNAANNKAITPAELETILTTYREFQATLELNYAKSGFSIQSRGESTFHPIEKGLVEFSPEGKATLEKAYQPDPADPTTSGRSLSESKTVPGVLEGKSSTGQVTYFIEGESPAFKEGTAPKTGAEITKFLKDAGFTREEINRFGGKNATRLGSRSGARVAKLAEHFTVNDLKLLNEMLGETGAVLTDEIVDSLVDKLKPGDFSNADIKATFNDATENLFDPDEESGLSISKPKTRVRKPRARAEKPETSTPEDPLKIAEQELKAMFKRGPGEELVPLWKIAEQQLKVALLKKYPGEKWESQYRGRPEGAASNEHSLVTIPEQYSSSLNKVFEAKRLNLEQLGISRDGKYIGPPDKESVKALGRAGDQFNTREWIFKGAEQNIVFDVSGQGVTDFLAVGEQLTTLLDNSKVNYQKVWIQNGPDLIPIR